MFQNIQFQTSDALYVSEWLQRCPQLELSGTFWTSKNLLGFRQQLFFEPSFPVIKLCFMTWLSTSTMTDQKSASLMQTSPRKGTSTCSRSATSFTDKRFVAWFLVYSKILTCWHPGLFSRPEATLQRSKRQLHRIQRCAWFGPSAPSNRGGSVDSVLDVFGVVPLPRAILVVVLFQAFSRSTMCAAPTMYNPWN